LSPDEFADCTHHKENPKSEIRNPKEIGRMKKETQKPEQMSV